MEILHQPLFCVPFSSQMDSDPTESRKIEYHNSYCHHSLATKKKKNTIFVPQFCYRLVTSLNANTLLRAWSCFIWAYTYQQSKHNMSNTFSTHIPDRWERPFFSSFSYGCYLIRGPRTRTYCSQDTLKW